MQDHSNAVGVWVVTGAEHSSGPVTLIKYLQFRVDQPRNNLQMTDLACELRLRQPSLAVALFRLSL